MTVKFQLAQLNIAKGRDSMESELMRGFVDRLEEINALADQSDGFIWRLQTEDGDATSIQAFDDPNLIINMSVWRDIESLKHFVYRTIHVDLISSREQWFEKIRQAHQVLWWIPAGHQPDIEEAKHKLDVLRNSGPGPDAFTFGRTQTPSSA